ncbi:antirestriction protein ArdA [Stappia stellulata]|uniref:antirestriction protein ArdA n=1 Tax=Stappia stellulata TaxID=71235 RepID=UPI001CD23BA3|nr:antirestriction protein ArdA [Stappia stellulata]MCA1241465.1 antirestriction protein ArdA [Stappia stellulata]
MMLFYAQPYTISVEGFYFQTIDQYREKIAKLTDSFCQPVEEVELQVIEGGQIDLELFEAWQPGQAGIAAFIEAIDDWSYEDKRDAILAIRLGGYPPAAVIDAPGRIDLTVYHTATLTELAEEFVDEGLFGDIPERLAPYLDFERIARDLQHDGFVEAIVAGERLIVRFD